MPGVGCDSVTHVLKDQVYNYGNDKFRVSIHEDNNSDYVGITIYKKVKFGWKFVLQYPGSKSRWKGRYKDFIEKNIQEYYEKIEKQEETKKESSFLKNINLFKK